MMLSGIQPFYSENVAPLVTKIVNEKPDYSADVWQWLSDEARDLVNKLLDKDSSKRPSAVEALDHPWFKIVPFTGLIENENNFDNEKIRNNSKLTLSITRSLLDRQSMRL